MTDLLVKQTPKEIGGQTIREISQMDGIKYIMADDSWLLIRPSDGPPATLRAGRLRY
jgi:phosphomannomutase